MNGTLPLPQEEAETHPETMGVPVTGAGFAGAAGMEWGRRRPRSEEPAEARGWGARSRGGLGAGSGWQLATPDLSSQPGPPSRKTSVTGAGNRTCTGTSKRYQLCRVQVRPAWLDHRPPPTARHRQDSRRLPGGPSPVDTLSWACPLHPKEQKWGWGSPGSEFHSLPQVKSLVPTTGCGHLSGKDLLLLAELSCDLRV